MRYVILLLVALTCVGCKCRHPASGCRFKATITEVIANLQHNDPTVRRDAAIVLRTTRGIPEQALAPLDVAIRVEPNKETHGEMLVTLAMTGEDIALVHIESVRRVDDTIAQRYTTRAMEAWRTARGTP